MEPSSQGAALKQLRTEQESSLGDIIQSLEHDILFGVLRPRERLVEDVLMLRFFASRHTVRQALIELERIGIVTRTPNRGASVRDFTAEEVEEIAELREILHRRAAQRMLLPADRNLLNRLVAIQRCHDKAVVRRDLRAIDDANHAFHTALFGACGNKLLSDAIGHYSYLSRATRLYPVLDPEVLETVRLEHWAMIGALKTCNRKELVRLVVGHIQHAKRLYLNFRRATDAKPARRPERTD